MGVRVCTCAQSIMTSPPIVTLHLFFRYLVHGQHIPETLWPCVGDADVYNEGVVRFLSLILHVCQEAERRYYKSNGCEVAIRSLALSDSVVGCIGSCIEMCFY